MDLQRAAAKIRLYSGKIDVIPAARRAIGAFTHFRRATGCGQ
jgi:hypothetical protein